MGNQAMKITDENLYSAEAKMLTYSGVPSDKIEIKNVVVDNEGHYLRTYEIGNKDNQKLVLVHGYAASSVQFYKIMKPLSDKYHLIMFDIIGMGVSSRIKFSIDNAEDANEFFVSIFEKWRVEMGDLKGFVLAGHSFGGYLCGHYASRYPQHIKKLLLLSPVGINEKPEDYDIHRTRFGRKEQIEPHSMCICVAKNVWRKKLSPQKVMRQMGPLFATQMIAWFVEHRIAHLPKEEKEDLQYFYYQVYMKKGSTEKAIFICFELGIQPHHSAGAKDKLGNPDLPIPVSFFYGDNDWTDPQPGEKVVAVNKFKGTLSRVYYIKNSDHHLYFDNPEQFTELMIEDIERMNEYEKQKNEQEELDQTRAKTDSELTKQSESMSMMMSDQKLQE